MRDRSQTNNIFFSRRLGGLCASISLVLAASLPFLIPFGAGRNIDLQGLILIIAGGFGWFALLLTYRASRQTLATAHGILLGVFAACCVISLAVNPHKAYDLLGAPYIRLGSLGLLACVGYGLLTSRLPTSVLVRRLYIGISGLAMLSVPYNLIKFHTLLRIGGVFAQADIFACFLGCGLLLGLHMLQTYPRQKRLLLSSQIFLAALLVLTETRAVLIIVSILYLVWGMQHQRSKTLRQMPLYIIALALLLFGLHHFTANRLTNARYASESLRYRLQLQTSALKAGRHRPWGYGAGNLSDALDCKKLSEEPLQTTCRQGYLFNSSHNIFIDRVLAIGWLGGLSYLLLVIFAAYTGLRSKKETRIFGYVIVLIGAYYLTNVTSVALELLLWVLLLKCLVYVREQRNRP